MKSLINLGCLSLIASLVATSPTWASDTLSSPASPARHPDFEDGFDRPGIKPQPHPQARPGRRPPHRPPPHRPPPPPQRPPHHPPHYPDRYTPIGNFDSIDRRGLASGWTCDPDNPYMSTEVHLYIDRPAEHGGWGFLGSVPANEYRRDVVFKTPCRGNHGFTFYIPHRFFDGRYHTLYAYGIDSSRNEWRNSSLGAIEFICNPRGHRPGCQSWFVNGSGSDGRPGQIGNPGNNRPGRNEPGRRRGR